MQFFCCCCNFYRNCYACYLNSSNLIYQYRHQPFKNLYALCTVHSLYIFCMHGIHWTIFFNISQNMQYTSCILQRIYPSVQCHWLSISTVTKSFLSEMDKNCFFIEEPNEVVWQRCSILYNQLYTSLLVMTGYNHNNEV